MSAQKQENLERLRLLEEEMNRVFQEVADLEENETNETEDAILVEDEAMADHSNEEGGDPNGEVMQTEEFSNSEKAEESNKFLGKNPSAPPTNQITFIDEVVDRIKSWILKGLTEPEEKEKLLKTTQRTGQLNLEAPKLNDEVSVGLLPRSLARDEHFREYQNLTGSALALTASTLSDILNDNEVPLDRDELLTKLSNAVKLQSHLFFSLTTARKSFLLGGYEEKVQKILKKIEPTTFLFGDNLKAVIDSSKVMEKVSKDLKLKPKAPFRQTQGLNWRSSTARREVGRGSFRNTSSNQPTFRSNQNRTKPYPAKRVYSQSQPQRNRR